MELNQRMPSLDGLRALSIAVVLIAHFTGTSKWWIGDFAYFGVRIFLVISGFLITSLLRSERERTGAINLKRFYIRRAFRILPAAYVYLIVVTIFYHQLVPWKYLLAAYTYLTCYAVHSPWVVIQLWSLSVEEQFYLIWPALMALGLLTGKRSALTAIAAAPIVRYILSSSIVMLHWKGQYNLSLWSFPAVFDSIAAGCLLALYQPELARFGNFFRSKYFPLIWAVTLAIPVGRHYLYHVQAWHGPGIAQTFAIPLFNLGIVLCIQNALLSPPGVLNFPPVMWVGKLSYSLYLWNMVFTFPGDDSWIAGSPQNLVLTFLAAMASYYWVEIPFLKIRKRVFRLHRHHGRKSDARRAPFAWSRQEGTGGCRTLITQAVQTL